jgi:hypothetical protein
MIQRIQTIFLLLALILISVCFFLPIANVYMPNSEIYSFNLLGFKFQNDFHRITSLMFSGFAICGLLLVTIFLFKNRILQMRLCIYNIVLMVGINGIVFYLLMHAKNNNNALIYYQITSVFPLLAAILTYMAFRRIRKDELLVKSYDRLR